MKATNWFKLGIYCAAKFNLRDGFNIVGILPDALHVFTTCGLATLDNPNPPVETTPLELVLLPDSGEMVYVGYAETSNTVIVQEVVQP